MSTLFNRILGNLATRMMFIIYLSIIAITGFFIVFSYYNELELQEQRQYDKLTAAVSAMAPCIDGDEHEALMNRYNSAEADQEAIRNDPFYSMISEKLQSVVDANKLSPMYTLVYNEEDSSFVYGVRSGDFIDFKNTYQQSPKELREQKETGGVIPMYMSENGAWLSAFHPIRNSSGKVIALLEADIEFGEFQTLVFDRYKKEVFIALGVIVAIALILIPYARRVLAKDEIQKKLVLTQKITIESKNRDIMDSIHYALKIQSAILPSERAFAENGVEGFIFHKAKDVVAGDFYWIERHEDYLYFAVADCTGHGVPGAILSLICANALNRAVDVMKIRETGLILDAVRDIIIARLGKGDGKMNDGMDVSICRLNLTTLEMQYSGANNPAYIVSSKTGEITIGKPCKQPVGVHLRQTPFQCHLYQLEKGDLVYLFTDGFADQFGGKLGKKYKYKPFQHLILKNAGLDMGIQKEKFDEELNDWMQSYEQIDDVCIMGVKV